MDKETNSKSENITSLADVHTYDSNKAITIEYNSNNQIIPTCNVPWVVYENKKTVLKPMILSEFLKNRDYDGQRILNYLIVRGKNTDNTFLIYTYINGVYKITSKDEFKGIIRRFIPQILRTKRAVDEVFADLISEEKFINQQDLDNDEDIINFQDGILKISTMELLPHSPKYLSTIQLPAKYRDVKNCEDYAPNFDKLVNNLFDDEDTLEIAMECAGLAISNIFAYRPKKFIIMVGKGNSGKSQFKRVLETLVGRENVSNVDLKTLNERFGTSRLYGKRLAGCNDMGFQTIKDMNILKQITDGDGIDCEFKNQGSFSYIFKGFVWFTSNSLPTFGGDKGKWVYERFIPIICDNVVPENERDPRIFDKIMLEKNVVIKRMLEALKRLISKDFKITLTEKMKSTLASYEVENNTLLTFIKECCIDATEVHVKTKRSVFNKCYANWCKIYNNGKGKLGNNTVKLMLKEKYGENYKLSAGIWYMDKLAIKPNIQEDLGVYDSNERLLY